MIRGSVDEFTFELKKTATTVEVDITIGTLVADIEWLQSSGDVTLAAQVAHTWSYEDLLLYVKVLDVFRNQITAF